MSGDQVSTVTEHARCEDCGSRVPDGGSLVYYAGRWRCDLCRVDPLAAPRWVRKGHVRREATNCWWCGSHAGHIVRNAHPAVACLACGTVQCSGSNGKCAACFRGWLPGWSRGYVWGDDGRNVAGECGYKGCTSPAVADAPRVHRVCSEHTHRARERGMTLAEIIAQAVERATHHTDGYRHKWCWMVWTTSIGS